MSDDTNAWAAVLGIQSEQAAEFDRLAAALGSSAVEILRMMVDRVIQLDRRLSKEGLAGIPVWVTSQELVSDFVDEGVEGLPLDIRPTGFMWPADKPFPWTAEQCKAAVIGYEVKWPGDFDDFLNLLRGEWEMSDGYAFLRQR